MAFQSALKGWQIGVDGAFIWDDLALTEIDYDLFDSIWTYIGVIVGIRWDRYLACKYMRWLQVCWGCFEFASLWFVIEPNYVRVILSLLIIFLSIKQW